MKLRPHHLLCIQNFAGHGYSPEFTAHMQAVTRSLAAEPSQRIELVEGCDDLCAHCPHNDEGACASLEKVSALDAGMLAACELAYGDEASWEELSRTAKMRVGKTEEFTTICSCCQWFELCRALR